MLWYIKLLKWYLKQVKCRHYEVLLTVLFKAVKSKTSCRQKIKFSGNSHNVIRFNLFCVTDSHSFLCCPSVVDYCCQKWWSKTWTRSNVYPSHLSAYGLLAGWPEFMHWIWHSGLLFPAHKENDELEIKAWNRLKEMDTNITDKFKTTTQIIILTQR